jgi:hypothetical protein
MSCRTNWFDSLRGRNSGRLRTLDNDLVLDRCGTLRLRSWRTALQKEEKGRRNEPPASLQDWRLLVKCFRPALFASHWFASWTFGLPDVVSITTACVGEITKKIVWHVVGVTETEHPDGITPKPVESME